MTSQIRHNAPSDLEGHHRKTYDAIFRHPMAHNLEWHDVRSLLNALAEVVEKHNGAIEVTRNGQAMTLHTPKHKDLASVEELLEIRHFLDRSNPTAIDQSKAASLDLLVVIDHHEAKVFRSEAHGTVPQRLVPYDPHGFLHHLRSETPETDGKREPERKSFYEAIAKTLRGADRVLIFGSGTGESSAMDKLIADLNHNHGDLAKLVVGSVVIDANHLTESELLAKAREFFGSRA